MLYDYQIRDEDRQLIISKLTNILESGYRRSSMEQPLIRKHEIWLLHRRILFGGITTRNLYLLLLTFRRHTNSWWYDVFDTIFTTSWTIVLNERLIPKPMSWYTSLGKINEEDPYDQYNRAVVTDSMCQSLEVTVTRPVFRVVKQIPDTPYWAQLQNKYGRRKHL